MDGRLFILKKPVRLENSTMDNSTYLFADGTEMIGSPIKWSKENRLEFNLAKFETSCFGVKKLNQRSVHLYADHTEIKCKSSVNDLSIIITNKLKWDSHINQRLSNAQQKFFIPFSTNTRVKASLYKNYISSLLLYASNVWFSNWPNCRKLEMMQRRTLKKA